MTCDTASALSVPLTKKATRLERFTTGAVKVMRWIFTSFTKTAFTQESLSCTTASPGNKERVWALSPKPRRTRSNVVSDDSTAPTAAGELDLGTEYLPVVLGSPTGLLK